MKSYLLKYFLISFLLNADKLERGRPLNMTKAYKQNSTIS